MKKRMDYLDVAMGIAMFLVVMGHAALAYDTPYWRVAIYSFHMPLFFLVSGVVACAVKDGKVDFDETLAPLRAVEPLATRCGGAYAAFRDLLLETRADGVITPEESDELCALLRRMKTALRRLS